MINKSLSIRPFIGSQNFERSSAFYKHIGFEEVKLSLGFSLFTSQSLGFYLQDAYVKDWVENTQVFFEVEDVDLIWKYLSKLQLSDMYPEVKITPIREEMWGKECFLHDPSGILWHFGEFSRNQ